MQTETVLIPATTPEELLAWFNHEAEVQEQEFLNLHSDLEEQP